MSVTITLKSGEKVRGEVVEVTSEEVVLGRPGNSGFRKDRYAAGDIERIEFGKPTGTANFVAGVFVGISFMLGVLAFGMAMSGPVNLS